jgi:DNA helicase-2/ATP-dependent DNA helicase PcrA
MEEGILPHKRSVEATEKEIDEERRLCYVAITRAKDHLTLTRAANRRKWGKLRPSTPSRFLREMRRETDPHDQPAVQAGPGPDSAAQHG